MNDKTILIADDDPAIVKLLQTILEMNKFNVISTYDGRAALDKAKELNPDLIILDIDMPEMNGLEVLEEVKNNPSTQTIPIIMLTARTMGDDFEKAMEKNADWYIAKPFRKEHLLEKIALLLEKYQNPQ